MTADRPIHVLFVLEAGVEAQNYKDACFAVGQYRRYRKPASPHPAVLAYKNHPGLRDKCIFRRNEEYICHDWVCAAPFSTGKLTHLALIRFTYVRVFATR
ncbi:MAG TPA: hypothetical protein VGO47_01710 [Chlamydiales bacterium]|nr:hypothetical protein [Chlamydiales bacterium]